MPTPDAPAPPPEEARRPLRPVMQTRFGDPEGNCLMASVASILGIALDECPDLYEYEKRGLNWWLVPGVAAPVSCVPACPVREALHEIKPVGVTPLRRDGLRHRGPDRERPGMRTGRPNRRRKGANTPYERRGNGELGLFHAKHHRGLRWATWRRPVPSAAALSWPTGRFQGRPNPFTNKLEGGTNADSSGPAGP